MNYSNKMTEINKDKLIEELAKSMAYMNVFCANDTIEETDTIYASYIAHALREAGIEIQDKDMIKEVREWQDQTEVARRDEERAKYAEETATALEF